MPQATSASATRPSETRSRRVTDTDSSILRSCVTSPLRNPVDLIGCITTGEAGTRSLRIDVLDRDARPEPILAPAPGLSLVVPEDERHATCVEGIHAIDHYFRPVRDVWR